MFPRGIYTAWNLVTKSLCLSILCCGNLSKCANICFQKQISKRKTGKWEGHHLTDLHVSLVTLFRSHDLVRMLLRTLCLLYGIHSEYNYTALHWACFSLILNKGTKTSQGTGNLWGTFVFNYGCVRAFAYFNLYYFVRIYFPLY